MNEIYSDVRNPASFSSVNKLWLASKNLNKITKADVEKWLQNQESYTLHKNIRKRFPMNKYYVNNINDLFQADLIDLKSLSAFNDNYQYLLTVIDVFSKYAWVEPLKTKSAKEVAAAFIKIFTESGRIPVNMETDAGKEFVGSFMDRNVWKKYSINHFTAKNPNVKACVIERFNRTLKTKMFKYFTHANTYRYFDVLNDFMYAYNNSIHRTIKMKPSQVNDGNILQVYENTYEADKKKYKYTKIKYRVGDYVRITKYKHIFQKSYDENFTREVFKIIQVIKRKPVVYKLCDLQNEPIDGVFYQDEIQKVVYDENNSFKIDKIINTRIRRGKREVLVKWKGYPEKFNSWLLESEVKT